MSTATRPDLATIVAIAVVAYALSNFTHEGIGHGGACLLAGCDPVMLTSMSFYGDEDALGGGVRRFIAAGGSLANVLAGIAALLLLRRASPATPARWFFLWLFAAINLLQAAGYLMFSGMGNIGDWAVVARDTAPPWLWRSAFAGIGGVAYYLIADRMLQALGARLPGAGAERLPVANRITLTAYFTGALLYLAAGAADPGGVQILLVSAISAGLGGTSALAWGPQLLRDRRAGPFTAPALELVRDLRWIAAAVLVAAPFILVLGPGLAL